MVSGVLWAGCMGVFLTVGRFGLLVGRLRPLLLPGGR